MGRAACLYVVLSPLIIKNSKHLCWQLKIGITFKVMQARGRRRCPPARTSMMSLSWPFWDATLGKRILLAGGRLFIVIFRSVQVILEITRNKFSRGYPSILTQFRLIMWEVVKSSDCPLKKYYNVTSYN